MNVTSVAVTVDSPDSSNRCELLGPFALFVQGALGALACLVLLWKRSREHPQRPLQIWFMDVCKQIMGAVFVHAANLLLSLLSSGSFTTEPVPSSIAIRDSPDDDADDGKYHANPCSFYLLNLGIDTTVGVIILIYLLRLFTHIVRSLPWVKEEGLESGYYGEPPRWSWWAKQSAVYFAGLMGMKVCVGMIFAVFPWLGMVGDWLLRWTEGDRRLQVAFVMFLFPLVMNAFQYYIIDSFIKFSGLEPEEEDALHEPSLLPPNGVGSPRESFAYDEEASAEERLLPKQVPSASSAKSMNSSMMLLPGSRGDSTPGYDDASRRTAESARWNEDESTLVER